MIVMPHTAIDGEAIERADGQLAIDAGYFRLAPDKVGQVIGQRSGWRTAFEARSLIFHAERGGDAIGQVENALIFEPAVLPGRFEAQRLFKFGAVAVAIGVGIVIGDAIAQSSVEHRKVEAGIADKFAVMAVVGRVAAKPVNFHPTCRIIAPQVDAGICAERQFRASGDIAVGITIPLAAAKGRRDRGNAVSGEGLAADPPAQRAGHPAQRGAGTDGIARSGFDVEAAFQWRLRAGGDDVDHAADRLASPERRLGATQHLNSLRIPDEQIGEIIAAAGRGRIVELHPVDDHDGLFGFRTADAQRCGGAIAAVSGQADARRAQQQFGCADILRPVDCGLVQNRDGGGHLVKWRGRAGGGDDNAVCIAHLVRCLRQCRAGKSERDDGGRSLEQQALHGNPF